MSATRQIWFNLAALARVVVRGQWSRAAFISRGLVRGVQSLFGNSL